MGNAVHKQHQSLETHFADPRTAEDDIAEDLHARIIGLELELKGLREAIAGMRGDMAARDAHTAAVFDVYRSIISDLTEVIERQRDAVAGRG